MERITSFPLPELLRVVYLEHGNGGFGPGYGVLGLRTGHPTDLGDTAMSLYESFIMPDDEDPGWFWPRNLLPIIHIGCAIHLCVDLAHPYNQMIRFDPNGCGPGEDWSRAFSVEASSLREWLSRTGIRT